MVDPLKPTNKTFKKIIDLVKVHYCLQPSVIVQCFTDNIHRQKEGESTVEFVVELCRLSEHCQLDVSLDNMLRDQLVCGIQDWSDTC